MVFLFIQITASKLMSDFRLSTFTVSIVSGKWVFSIRSFRFVYHARDEGTQNPWRISKENTSTLTAMPGLSTVYKPKIQTHPPEYAAHITVPRCPWSLSRSYSVQGGGGPESDCQCDGIPAQARGMVRVRLGISFRAPKDQLKSLPSFPRQS